MEFIHGNDFLIIFWIKITNILENDYNNFGKHVICLVGIIKEEMLFWNTSTQ